MRVNLKAPCDQCPFTRNGFKISGEWGQAMQKMANNDGEWFVCHKTLDLPKSKKSACPGYMAMTLKMERPNIVTRMAITLNLIDPELLINHPMVYSNWDELIKEHADHDSD